MSFNSRYAKDKKKKKFWDEDNDPDEGHHSKLTPEQKAKAKARAKANGRPYPNKVDNVWAAKEASVVTAGAYPNADHLKQIIAELKDAVNHCEQGDDWHSERGESEMAQHHEDAAEALSVAIESLEKVIRDGDAGMPVSEKTERTAKKNEDHYQYIKKQGDKWVITQKGTGKVLSHHDTREKAIEAFHAMMASKHGANSNERYAHDSFHFWPEDPEDEDTPDELIDHLSDHHHGQFKEIVAQLNSMIDSSPSRNNISQDERKVLVSKLLKQHLTDLSSSGGFEPNLMLAMHDYVHNRTDGPDRGYDLITKQNPDQVEKMRKSLGHDHTSIPEF